MKNLCKALLTVAIAATAFSIHAQAQTVQLNGLGSSAMFLELGQGANYSSGAINAPCVWSETSNTVQANDTTAPFSATTPAVDKGSAWVAWTVGSDSTCATATKVYAYLQTDSVVGNRCLFDGKCTIAYPTSPAAPAGAILPLPVGTNCATSGTPNGECPLPSSVVTALNASSASSPNFAGTDIRPEDAAFAIARATTPCGQPVVTGSKYLGLGYSTTSVTGATINEWSPVPAITGYTPGSFNVVSFGLPNSYSVTPLGVVPIIVVANSNVTAANGALTQFSDISSANLAKLLDGTFSSASQLGGTGSDPVYAFVREPLSGTYNVMEYNDPNTTTNETSQDVGYLQPGGPVNPGSQYNCTAVTGGTVLSNPLNIATTGGGSRDRAIGTGNALKINRLYANSSSVINNLGYGFWSTANFAGYAGVTTAKYLTVDGEDPLGASGVIPTTPAEVAAINFAALYTANTTGKNYPLWSLIRLVNIGSSAPTTLTNLVSAAQAQVGTTHDFALPSQLQVVRSHFIPPVGTGEPTIAFDGHVGLTSSACSATEAGGDVGGVVIALKGAAMPPEPDSDNTYCSSTGIVNGQTGHRR